MSLKYLLVIGLIVSISGAVVASDLYRTPRVILNTEIPIAPTTVAYFRVINEERDFYISNDLMKPKTSLPSNETALKIVKEFISKRGGLPRDAKLSKIERVMLKALNVKTGEIIDQKPLFVSIKYKRELNGLPVIGPGDEIEIAVASDILYYSKKWRKVEYAGKINIITAKEALKKFEKGSMINKPMGVAYPLTVYDIKLGYYSDGKQKYYYPVWIFYCKDKLGNYLKLAVEAVR